MRRFRHFAAMAVAVVLMVALVGSLAIAGPSTTASTAAHDQYGKTAVCHATGSAKNPYVYLKVPQNSAHFSKHPDDLFGPAVDSKDDCPDGDGKKAKGKDEGSKAKASKAKASKAKDNKGKDNKGKANKGKANKGKANKGKANKGKANKGKGRAK